MIRAVASEHCFLCGTAGVPLYSGLRDRLFSAPGQWNLKKCPSSDCGLIWLDPMPIPDDIGQAYVTYYTHAPSGFQTAAARIYSRFWRAYLRYRFGAKRNRTIWHLPLFIAARLHPGGRTELDYGAMFLGAPDGHKRLLDIGFGDGRFLLRMQELGWQCQGVDFDAQAVSSASSRGLTVRQGDLRSQRYPSDDFDAITMSHSIEHIHEPLELLQECYRILKPGGRLVVVTPNSRSWGHRHFGEAWLGLDPPRHLILFNPQNLRASIEGTGFAIMSVFTSAREARLIWMLSRKIRRHAKVSHNLATELLGLPYQATERILLRVRSDAGEEIVLIAAKPR